MSAHRILGVIPARAGSKGIRGKNLALIAGKPLIQWTIEAALSSNCFTNLVVSTDGPDIAEVSKSLGAEVPFLRPAHLALDDTPGLPPILHAMDEVEALTRQPFDYVICLQPTSPLRTAEDIQNVVALASEKGADGVVAVKLVNQPFEWMKRMSSDGRLTPFLLEGSRNPPRRQETQELHIPNGAIYLAKTSILRERNTFYTENTFGYRMPLERSVDVDTPVDLLLAELLLIRQRI